MTEDTGFYCKAVVHLDPEKIVKYRLNEHFDETVQQLN